MTRLNIRQLLENRQENTLLQSRKSVWTKLSLAQMDISRLHLLSVIPFTRPQVITFYQWWCSKIILVNFSALHHECNAKTVVSISANARLLSQAHISSVVLVFRCPYSSRRHNRSYLKLKNTRIGQIFVGHTAVFVKAVNNSSFAGLMLFTYGSISLFMSLSWIPGNKLSAWIQSKFPQFHNRIVKLSLW